MSPRSTSPHGLAIRRLRGFFGYFPQVTRIQGRLQELIEQPDEGTEPECVAILGDTGTGKSTLLENFVSRHPRIEHDEFTEIPCLYVGVTSRCTVKMLASLLLHAMGSPFWNRGDELERTIQLVTLLKACRVRLIVLDEVNHLGDRGAAKSHYFVADWLKQLIRASRVPVVLAGTPAAAVLWQTNEQLADRYREVFTLEPFSMAPHRVREFRSVLQAFAGLMEGIEVVDLKEPHLVQAMAFATAGRLRDIRHLLVRAVEIGQREPVRPVTLKVLAQAFVEKIFPKAPDHRNPFLDKFNGHPLTAPGEPFCPRRLES